MRWIPTPDTIMAAARRIAPYARHTPVLTSQSLDALAGASLFFKCEHLQKVGAFKFRGACNTVFSLTDAEVANGVATHSSGNHAQALALAARLRGAPAYIVMPENAPDIKKRAVAAYGANITYCAPNLVARESTLAAVVAETGAAFIHPYNDERVIAGQATAAHELLNEVPDLDLIMVPVGGGGLLSGTALAAYYHPSTPAVIAAEPQGADDAKRSFDARRIIPSENPQTIADGLLTSLGDKTFVIIQEFVLGIVTVSDDAIIAAMRIVWERMKQVIEPSAAVPLAAILDHRIDVSGRRVGIILSGGNVDLDHLPWRKGDLVHARFLWQR
ncbi:MAG: pyridoxal-phosphate dependent enzyme [Bacteroidetes bacterium]|nr:pyridoxal-phosphate dependent enzyme [Bacteroidota bacterium]